MRVLTLVLPEYKNLRGFRIGFDPSTPDVLIVGNNGTGKSNLIEALVTIFRDLIEAVSASRLDTPFAFAIRFEIAGRQVDVDHRPDRKPGRTAVRIDGRAARLKDLHDPDKPLLPRTVFAYYSGPSDRLAKLFDNSLLRFRDAMIAGDSAAHERLIYGRMIHSRFVLLAFLIEEDPGALDVLRDELGISDLASALFVLQRPEWQRAKRQTVKEKAQFWGAKGVVRDFLERLYDVSLAPLQLDVQEGGILGARAKRQRLHLFLSQAHTLRDIVDEMRVEGEPRSRTLFRLLESAFVSDLIHDVAVVVRKAGAPDGVGFRELSEGEQQLLMVLGLLRFTRNEESLFLLDEPDTHLNPIWGMRLLDLVSRVVGQDSSRHLLLVTHDPVAVASASRDQVRLLVRREDGHVVAMPPLEEPERLGVPGVLTSELFGLSSLVAPDIERDLEARRSLVSLGQTRSPEETDELERLSAELADVDLAATMPDPLYAEFLSRIRERDERLLRNRSELTRAEIDKRDQILAAFLDEIFGSQEEE
ncbi:ATP-binding protein [Sphingomonas sp. PL-96]|uniref:AAA family ATPase n=1 Tax=Sphingomonas sp. PL-96 TaxID=2887201 RepID=UPI001E4FADBB|nr:AAA family ATPase [Sphingomonas sp. PL-96]MCC2976261.1 ATP-binding protein [Sphingomonas sp. PL-96]